MSESNEPLEENPPQRGRKGARRQDGGLRRLGASGPVQRHPRGARGRAHRRRCFRCLAHGRDHGARAAGAGAAAEGTCNDVAKLDDGRAHYNGLLYPNGGFVDDIIIYQLAPDDFFVVVNASNTDKDFEWFQQAAQGMDVEVRNVSADYAQLAMQGPNAERILQGLTDVPLAAIKYYRFDRGAVDGAPRSSRAPATRAKTGSRSTSRPSTRRASCRSSSTPA